MNTWRKENSTAEHIPYSAQINENTVRTLGGDYVQVIKLEGVSHETSDPDTIVTWKEQLNTLLKNVASPRICIWSTTIRRRVTAYPEGAYHNEFDQKLNEKYKAKITQNQFLINELYLSVIYRPEKTTKKLFKKVIQTTEQIQADTQNALEAINEVQETMIASLTEYTPRVLGTYTRLHKQTQKEVLHSELLEFFDYLINGNQVPRALTPRPLNVSLARSRPFFGTDAFELRDVTDSVLGAIITINDYPELTEAGLLNAFLSAPFELIITQSFHFLSKPVATELIKRQQNRMISAQDHAQSQINAIHSALDDLSSSRIVFGEHHLSLTVLAHSKQELKRHLSEARSTLADCSIVVAREDWGIAAAFWAQLPSNTQYRPRPAPISSKNFAGFSSFHNYPMGHKDGNQWGSAVTVFKTSSGAPYYFNFHEYTPNRSKNHNAIGTTLIIGPTGTGKTVTQGMLISQSKKYSPTQIIFDKDRGLEIYVRLSGGVYLPLKYGKPTGFNPFQLENNAKNRGFLVALIKKLLNIAYTPQEESDIQNAVQGVLEKKNLYRMEDCLQFLPTRLKPYLHKWCKGGALDWVFDNEHDSLNMNNAMFGFDVTEFLEHAEIRTPIIMYLFHRIDELFDGKPVQIFMDEFWRLLDDEYFQDFAKNKNKVIRKQNGIMVYGTQSASDVIQSSISKTLIEQCATYILMPNNKASREDYVNGLHLTEREFQLIKEEMSVASRQFLIKQNGKSVVAELDLKGFDDELSVISGTTENVLKLERILENTPNIDEWLTLFHTKEVAS